MNNNLYILVRTDLDSMTDGRVAAQVAHASSLFTLFGENLLIEDQEYIDLPTSLYNNWKDQANGFGTTIVLDGGSKENIENIILNNPNHFGGWVYDSTYRVSDGDCVHSIGLETCYWLFFDTEYGENQDIKNLPLLNNVNTKIILRQADKRI